MTAGNYGRVLPLILARATDVVWLDFGLWLVMSRVVRRSVARVWSGRELWPGSGNRENWRHWLGKEHPIRWTCDTFASRRARYEALFSDSALTGVSCTACVVRVKRMCW